MFKDQFDVKNKEREFHDRRFEGDDKQRSSVSKYYDLISDGSDKYLSLVYQYCSHAKVLEYGCGIGEHTHNWLRHGAHVVGIDISPEGIRIANENAKKYLVDKPVDYHVMDAENTSFSDGEFNLIIGSGILHHLDVQKAINENVRLLSDSGRVVYFEPLGHNVFINLYRWFTPGIRTDDEHPLMEKDLRLIDESFAEVDYYYYGFLVLFAVFFKKNSFYLRLKKSLSKIDGFIVKRLPFMRRYFWVVVIDAKK